MINGKDQEIITINKTGNSILNNAKYSADNTDEWYTTYETIAEELSHYKNQFIDKVVLCNCDDPFESNFCYYFLRHFNQLKLKKLICTSYSGSKIDQLVNGQLTLDLLDADGNPVINNKHGYVLTITQIPGEHEEEVPDNVIKNVLQKKNVVRKLSGNGDFRSQECIEYLKECDICCTNPPFSLFSELFSLLVKYDKKYLLIGNQNAITYKEIFPYIKENKAWVGYRFGDMAFRVPQDTMPRKTRYWVDEYGQKWRSLGNANVDVLNAADFGVPQSRERAIFICSKQMPISLPKPTVSKKGLQMLQGIFVKVIMLIMSRSIGYILKYHIIGN